MIRTDTRDRSVSGAIVLRNGSFRLFGSAQLVSATGDAFRRMAVLLVMYEMSNRSGVAVASLVAAELLPAIALGPIAGAVVDRRNQRVLLIAADFARAVLSLALIVAVLLRSLELLYLFIVLASCISTFAVPAQYSLLPRVVTRAELQGANALLVFSNQAALVLGPPLAVATYYSFGATFALAIDASSFLLSGLALLALPWRPMTPFDAQVDRFGGGRIWSDAIAGLRYVARTPLLAAGALALGGVSVAAGLNGTAMIFFVSSDLGRDPGDVAWLSSANGIAQVAMGLGIATFAARLQPEMLLFLGTGAMAVGGILSASSPSMTVLVSGVILVALGNGPFNIASATVEQTYIPQDYLGRARGVLELLSTMLMVAAAGAAGYGVAILGSRAMLIVSAGALVVVFLATTLMLVPIIRGLRANEASAT